MAKLRVALVQLDAVVGDLAGNATRVAAALDQAAGLGADLVAFPELVLAGYPPEDLLLKPAFVAENLEALDRVVEHAGEQVAVIGFVDLVQAPGPRNGGGSDGAGSAPRGGAGDPLAAGRLARQAAVRGAPKRLRNAAAVARQGRLLAVYHKRVLPNYAVFDEDRWFAPGSGDPVVVDVAGIPVGVTICEDLWFPGGPVLACARAGARLVVNINASPYARGRTEERLDVLRERVGETGVAIAYVNLVGGQDELVFDGASMVVDRAGTLLAAAPQFEEAVLLVDLEEAEDGSLGVASWGIEPPSWPPAAERAPLVGAPGRASLAAPEASAHRAAHPEPPRGCSAARVDEGQEPPDRRSRELAVRMAATWPTTGEEEVYEALVLGTRDYLAKNGFSEALVGLSGGIDSSLVATVAVDALGSTRVHGIAMPSRYSSTASVEDAARLSANLGIDFAIVAIEAAHATLAQSLAEVLGGLPTGLADENLQARIRGVILMTISNARGWIVLTTGNKSELATGYSTLYGDSAGGFAVIRDVPKTLVYRLACWRNARAGVELIPERVLMKPPSAELRPDQRDDQSLPPYEVLDPILEGIVERDASVGELVAEGFDPHTVLAVARLVDAAEYKRRQSPPGVRITHRAFGKDRRMPITNAYREGLAGLQASDLRDAPAGRAPSAVAR
jgi:NAD+ synthase (glutamine-hydrolysing)